MDYKSLVMRNIVHIICYYDYYNLLLLWYYTIIIWLSQSLFIHSLGHLFSVSARGLLRGAPDFSMTKQKFLI